MKEIYGVERNLALVVFVSCISRAYSGDNDYNVIHNDGSYEFGGDSPDSYHYANANRKNVVRGEFGGRNPKSGNIDRTVYTAGPRGFRPRGKNIVRNYDLNQSGPRPVGSPDDPYYDPYEDPSYQFGFKTRTHTRSENANRAGDVTGKFSYIDDIGERHNVEYIAGKRTGFHVKTPFPDSNPRAYGPLYFRGRGRPIPRGRTSIQRGLDGSYRFVSAGPDQRRTEVSDATGHVRGSYTYLDEKGIQHSVHYIAGPETGYRVLKNVRGPHLPTVFPFGRPEIISPDFYDDYNKDLADVGDVFGTGGADGVGSSKPGVGGSRPGVGSGRPGGAGAGGARPGGSLGGGIDVGKEDYDTFGGSGGAGGRPSRPKPTEGGDESYDDDYDLFGGGSKPKPGDTSSTSRPGTAGGSYKPTPSPTSGIYPTSAMTGSGAPGYDGASTTPAYGGGSPTPSYGGVSSTPSYVPGSSTPGYGGSTPTPSYPGGTGVSGYPGDTGRPEKPLPEYGPPGFGKPGAGGHRPGGYGDGTSPGSGVSGPGTGGDLDSNEIDDYYGIFGSPSGHGIKPPRPPGKPSYPGAGPSIQVGGATAPNGRPCEQCHTIVTNVGDRTFTVPPGVSVRAHVQAIDLIPYESKIPSPSAQMRADINDIRTEELNAEEDTLVDDKTETKGPTESTSPSLNDSKLESSESTTRSS